MDVSLIMCDGKIDAEETKTFLKNITCKIQNFYILLSFLSIAITFLIAVSIYCYLTKYRTQKNHLLPFHNTKNELRKKSY